jgi:hypothetical protein
LQVARKTVAADNSLNRQRRQRHWRRRAMSNLCRTGIAPHPMRLNLSRQLAQQQPSQAPQQLSSPQSSAALENRKTAQDPCRLTQKTRALGLTTVAAKQIQAACRLQMVACVLVTTAVQQVATASAAEASTWGARPKVPTYSRRAHSERPNNAVIPRYSIPFAYANARSDLKYKTPASRPCSLAGDAGLPTSARVRPPPNRRKAGSQLDCR